MSIAIEIVESTLTELIGADEQIDQNDFGGSVEVDLAGLAIVGGCSGEILSVMLFATEAGTGAILEPAGTLFIFDADPSISAGATSMSAAARVTVLGQVVVGANDWKADANGASVFVYNQPVPFHELDSLFLAWFHEDATSFNDGAGDDEKLEVKFWYRRDSAR